MVGGVAQIRLWNGGTVDGTTDESGRHDGYLNTPDGFDLLAPDHSTPTHPFTG
jgi:hypothetical protein